MNIKVVIPKYLKISAALQNEFIEKAKELVKTYNPYINDSIAYFIDKKPMYLRGGQLARPKSKEEMDADYVEQAVVDMARGYHDRMSGSYDKWYRYTRCDCGTAYDIGCKMASDNPKAAKEVVIIEIADCNK